jgi:hypothetical protein
MLGPRTVLCVPSKAIDAWLAAAVLRDRHRLLVGLECNLNLETQLRTLPRTERIKKTTRQYRDLEKQVTAAWPDVRERCSQADRFSNEVMAVLV